MNEPVSVPCFPDFAPLSLEMKDILHPRLSLSADGVSEFAFSGLYLFRNRYNYRISRDGPNGGFIISGVQREKNDEAQNNEQKFFMTPCETPKHDVLESLFATHDYWKNISETILVSSRPLLNELGVSVDEDRDNFDYLYFRDDMSQLSGKKFHKKRNLVSQFLHTYTYEQRPLTRGTVPHALEVLERWRHDKFALQAGEEGDYSAAREALELFDSLTLRGYVYFADGKPAGYCLGESIAKGKMFAVHFEKAIDEYKGIYQFMNQAFATTLPRFFIFINREQDLGNTGLRQAKMTYRPSGFVKKYTGRRNYAVK